eukprot:3750243-Amphidinium_carterae.1
MDETGVDDRPAEPAMAQATATDTDMDVTERGLKRRASEAVMGEGDRPVEGASLLNFEVLRHEVATVFGESDPDECGKIASLVGKLGTTRGADVAEVFCESRVLRMASQFGLNP